MPPAGRFTVDDLGKLPDWGLRAEVVDGRLLLGPRPSPRHDRVVRHLARSLRPLLPAEVRTHLNRPLRLPDGDGPVPDLLVADAATATDSHASGPVSVPHVHTVVEVVADEGRFVDRVFKRDRYAAAGVPCYWRVELAPWSGYRGPAPVVVVRIREPGGWRELVAAAGRVHTLPLACGRSDSGRDSVVPVRFDPRTLLVRPALSR